MEQKRILIVEDQPETVLYFEIILRKAGYITDSSPDGLKGLAKVDSFRPDLILLDINMPGMSGIEVCNEIRKDPANDRIKIAFISAYQNDSYKASALANGGDLYLTKPINRQVLLEQVNALWRQVENITENPGVNKSLNQELMTVCPIFNARKFQKQRELCFVLMPFGKKWSDRLYKAITIILERNGFIVRRADDLTGKNILEDIWRAINEAEFIVAEVTGVNPNVMYEIGIAHTLGKEVILLTQSANYIPFDFRHFRHIIYEDNVDGFSILENQLPKFLTSDKVLINPGG
jgi:CheY-like chemotaxis protein